MAFKAVSNIKHGAGKDNTKDIAAGTEVKKSDFDDQEWADLLAAGAITGADSKEFSENERAAKDAEQAARDRELLRRTETLDQRESQIDAKEQDLKQQQEQVERDREALDAERKALEAAGGKATDKEKASK